jgi:hypothetical protein
VPPIDKEDVMGVRFSRLLGLVMLVAALASGTANATTPLGQRADGLRWQAKARAYKELASQPTAQGLRADGLRWQAIARAYRHVATAPDAGLPPPQALRADAQRWQSMAQAYLQQPSTRAGSESDGFGWGDAGLGVGAGIALALLAVGGLALRRQTTHEAAQS